MTAAGPSEVVVRLPVVAVIGSGTEAHDDLAAPTGALVARLGAHLLTGAGGGVMAAAARAFCAVSGRAGLSIGIVPAAEGIGPRAPRAGYPNDWIEVPIYTHLPKSGDEGTTAASRNHIVMLTATAIVALPGGAGTASERALAARYARPLIAVAAAADLAAAESFLRRALAVTATRR